MKKRYLPIMASIAAIVACSPDGNSNSDASGSSACSNDKKGKCVDASSYTEYTYYTLEGLAASATNTLDIKDQTSKDWDIAFQRNNIIINDGIYGKGDIKVAINEQGKNDFYNDDGSANKAKFYALNPLMAANFFDKANANGVSFKGKESGASTGITHRGDKGWYSYDHRSHKPTIHDKNYFVVKGTAKDEYGRLRATNYTYVKGTPSVYSFSLSQYKPGATNSTGSWAQAATIDITFGKTPQCYDFSNADASKLVNCTSDKWDITFVKDGRFSRIYLNSAVQGGGDVQALGPFKEQETNRNPSNRKYGWRSDGAGNDFSKFPFFEYSLKGQHKMWPNCRVYLLKKNNSTYKFQVLSYYKLSNGKSGYPTIKIEKTQ